MTSILMKRENLDIETHIEGGCHVKMKAEIMVMHLQAKEHHRSPASHQKPGERPELILPHSPLSKKPVG